MELFDRKFMNFIWDGRLTGKKCIVGDNAYTMKCAINGDSDTLLSSENVYYSGDDAYPFESSFGKYSFCYYDPNFEVKRAFMQGKKIEVFYPSEDVWYTITDEQTFLLLCESDREFRIKDDEFVPFEKTERLIIYWKEHYANNNNPPATNPLIWIKEKRFDVQFLITGIRSDSIFIGNEWVNMKELFDDYLFLDGKVIGHLPE